MLYFLLGLFALLLALYLLKGFVRADVIRLARQLRVVAGSAALAAALVLVFRGMLSYAFPLAMLGSWLIWGRGPSSWGTLPGGGQETQGPVSRVVTDHLEMELDHDTGVMRGRVLKGAFFGRRIESMAPAELARLWRDCQFADPQSAQLIEAYLDRRHPSWREDMGRGEGKPGPGGGMTREEAFSILGLKAGASEEEIRRAHRELMLKIHPDRGGSSYLAAKINAAKEMLLGK